jgi:hypothetical protein
MKTLFEYVEQAEKDYTFRVKFAVPVDSNMIDKMEQVLTKFDVKKVGSVKKTILQGRPLDFVDIGPTEVYIVDVILSLPATKEAVRDLIVNGLKLSMNKVVVRTEHDPLDADREEQEPSKKPLLTSEYEKVDAGDKYYGDKYNQNLVKNHKSEFTYEIAGGKPKADSGPDYGDSKKMSPLGNRARPKLK